MKKNLLVVFIFSAVISAILFALLFQASPNDSTSPKYFNTPNKVQNNKQSFNELLDLEKELAKVAEANGEISAERYAEIEKILNNAEDKGYSKKKVNYLQGVLSNLIIVDSQSPQINEKEESTPATDEMNISYGNTKNDVIIWHYNGIDWAPSRVPPECPITIELQMPVDINLVTSVFYPGQVRGGNYKSHGGFRLDNSGNNIKVMAPFDGFLWRANRYIQSGEVQYTLEVIYPCGIMYMLDHLRTVSPKLMSVFSQLPDASEDSLPTSFNPLPVAKGELLATEIGMKDNVFIDFGVYDLREKNDAGQDPYSICGFDMLPLSDREKIQSLPASDDDAGKTSDYC